VGTGQRDSRQAHCEYQDLRRGPTRSYETKFFAEPVHFDDEGKWVNIETGLRAGDGATVENKANEFGLNLAEQADSNSLAKVEMDPDHSISMRLQGADDIEGDIRKDSVTYEDARTDTDLKLTSKRNGFKEELILSSADAPDRFVYPLVLEGLTAAVEGAGDVVYRDAEGVERARTPHGFMYDSNVDPNSGEPAISNGVTFAIIPHGAGQALEIKLDREWLNSPDREWPVTVDPDTYVFTKGDDTFVMSPFTQNYSTLNELKVGKPDSSSSVARAFLHFDTSQLNGVNVTSSYLFAREKHSWSPSQNPGPVYRVLDSSWTGASMVQFPGNPTDDGSPATGAWWPDGKTNPNRWAYWDITGMARSWAAAHEDNGSVSIRASNEASNLTWKKYHSANTALETTPMMTVAYTSGDPFGSTDNAVAVPGYGSGAANVYVDGWGIDPDTTGSIQAYAYAFRSDATVAAWVVLNADKQRPDVGIAYPNYGDNHGYVGFIPVPGPDTYTVCVALANVGQGTSIWLPCRTVRVDNYPSTAQNVQATANPDGTVKVTWVGPASNGNSAITGFNIQAFDANGTFIAYRLCSWGCRTATFNELILGTSYTIKVYAQNAIGYSLESTPVNVVPAKAPGTPGDPAASLDGNNVDVTWTAPAANGATIIRYDVRAHLASNDAAVGVASLTCGETCRAMEFTGLTPGTAYKFRIYGVNSQGASAAAVTNTLTIPSPTVPDVPGNPEATLEGDNVDVTWTAPATGPAVASYRVQAHVASTDAAGPQKTCDSPCTSVEFTTGLTAGTAYKFKVYAVNLAGDSSAAVTGTVTIPEGDPEVPDVPQNPQAALDGDHVDVTWSLPSSGGPEITRYNVRAHLASNDTAVGEGVPCGASCTSVEFPTAGLTAGAAYKFKVYAVNQVGDSVPGVTNEITIPDQADKFVYLAFGDSYSSGEGGGNDFRFKDPAYLSAYEPNTYAVGLDAHYPGLQPGNACHRSVENYAKLNRDRFEPGKEIVLIDVTCSGAVANEIYGSGEHQLSQAASQLGAKGLSVDDVDLVTLGVGGNDGRFAQIGFACVLPALIRKLVEAHPGTPIEIELAVHGLDCESVEDLIKFFDDTDQADMAIDGIKDKVKFLHEALAANFTEARILQVDYPDILPSEAQSDPYCGGIRAKDVEYASSQIKRINDQIRTAINESQADDINVELVELEDSFGSNALCPPSGARAVGIRQSDMDIEVARMMTEGNLIREAVDEVVSEYEDYKDCLGRPGGTVVTCPNNDALEAIKSLVGVLQDSAALIQANLVEPLPEEEMVDPDETNPEVLRIAARSLALRIDRSRGLFHPNAAGHAVQACRVLAVYKGNDSCG
jgi:lysophospholipase L1-like esterase